MSPAPRTKRSTAPATPPPADTAPASPEGAPVEGSGGDQDGGQNTELLNELTQAAQDARGELARLRAELDDANARTAPAAPAGPALSAEELAAQRAQEISEHDFYCPGCGKLVDYPQQCEGTATAPHPPIEVVTTEELRGEDTSKHTAAPAT